MFKTSLKPQYGFGIPRNVVIDGPGMDVDRIEHQVVEKNNDQEQWKAWNRASGARMSAMEHLVPEMMFSTEENPAHGISAVKALQLAAAEGQKIWTITQTNLNTALAAINLPSDIKTDIRNSVNAGKEVTAHETAVDFYGSSQVGYIVIDPETGAGGYLIGGGENGAQLIIQFLQFAVVFAGYAILAIALVLAGSWLALLATAIGAGLWVYGMSTANNYNSFNKNSALAVWGLVLGFMGLAELSINLVGMMFVVDGLSWFWGLI